MHLHGDSRFWLLIPLLVVLLSGCTPKYITLTQKGDRLFEKGDYEGAKDRYEAALNKYPKYAPALVKLGEMAVMDEDWDLAQQVFTATLKADPMMVKAYLGRGLAFLHLFLYQQAGDDFKRAKELGSARADVGLGIYYYLTDRNEAAFSALRYAVEQPGDADVAIKYVFKTAIASRDYESGRELLAMAAISDNPETVALHKRMSAELAYLSGDYAAAQQFSTSAKDLPYFGIWYREPSPTALERMNPFKGAIIEYVHLGSPAARAGMKASDVVTSFERKPIHSADELDKQIAAYLSKSTRSEALFEVLRGNQQLAIMILPDGFQTGNAIRERENGGDPAALEMAPKELMEFP